jgi:hypothetical protein
MRTPLITSGASTWLGDLAALRPVAVALDVEPLVAHWHDDDATVAARVSEIREAVAAIPSVEQLAFVTNSPRTVGPLPEEPLPTVWLTEAGKPFHPERLTSLHPGPWTVVGDQRLTDGLLAHRLRGTFLHTGPVPGTPLWPRLQARAGALTGRLFTRQPVPAHPQPVPAHPEYEALPAEAAERRLTVVLADYAEGRDDERAFVASMGVGIGLLVSILGAYVAVVAALLAAAGRPHPSDWLLAALPAAPLAILVYLQQQGTLSVIRSYYLRSLEREIALLDGRDRQSISGTYTHTILDVASLRRGRPGYRLLAMVLFLIVVAVFGGVTAFVVLNVAAPFKIAMTLIYMPPVILLVREAYAATLGGRRMWHKLMEGRPHVAVPERVPAAAERSGRSIWSYLLLPRVEELIKLSFLSLGFLYGALYRDALDARLWMGLLFGFLVFEYLFYEARYQWNDLRGAAEDEQHPYAAQRGRLPRVRGSLRTALGVSAGVMALRLVLAVATCIVMIAAVPGWRATGIVLLSAGAGAMLVGGVYEALRHSDQHPRVVWRVVGLGYGLRLSLGALLVAAAGAPAGRSPFAAWVVLPVALFVTGWAVGSTSILMAWALESTAWLYAPRGRVKALPKASPAQRHLRKRSDLTAAPSEIVLDAHAAKGRSHVAQLASTTDLKTVRAVRRRPSEGYVVPLTAFPVLQGSTGATVWNVTAVLAVLLTTAVGVFVSLSWAHPGLSGGLVENREPWATAGSAIVASVVAVVAIGRRSAAARWAWWGGLTVAVGAFAWWGGPGPPRPPDFC